MRDRSVASGLSLLAAFLWATYYLFVLAIGSGARPSAVLFYPFLSGGVAYGLWVVAHGNRRPLVRLFREPPAYLRAGLLVVTQIAILGATYAAGPVVASLLSLLGDVVLTPVLVAALVAAHRPELRAPAFVLGLLLSLVGGALTIVGGQTLGGLHGVAWVLVIVLPWTVALYFVLSARAGERVPVTVVVAHVTIVSAAAAFFLAPAVPGGWTGIVAVGSVPLALLLVNGVITFFVAPLCYFRAIERAGLVFPPMLMTGIPVFTLLLSATILGIPAAPLALLGVPIAAVGGVVALAAGARASRARASPITASR